MRNCSAPAESPKSAYIHIPFCKAKCSYCDFYSKALNSFHEDIGDVFEKYAYAVTNEIEFEALSYSIKSPLDTVYFGGGTPSLFPSHLCEKILSALDRKFGLSKDCEITIEANPESSEFNKLEMLKSAGFNRISIGIQSFSDELLKRLGRIHDGKTAIRALINAEKAGFENLSADLILALPGQTIEDLKMDISILTSYAAEHISAYSLIIEPRTPFFSRYGEEYETGEAKPETHAGDEYYAPLPEAETERKMYWILRDELRKKGFKHYEISNFAQPGFCSRHNLNYWRSGEYFGFGAGAASYVSGVRSKNLEDIDLYISAFEGGKVRSKEFFPFRITEEMLDEAGRMKEFFLLGFRLIDGVSRRDFKGRFSKDIPEELEASLRKCVKRGLVEDETENMNRGEFWKLSLKGIDFANEVFSEFV